MPIPAMVPQLQVYYIAVSVKRHMALQPCLGVLGERTACLLLVSSCCFNADHALCLYPAG